MAVCGSQAEKSEITFVQVLIQSSTARASIAEMGVERRCLGSARRLAAWTGWGRALLGGTRAECWERPEGGLA